MLVGLLALAFVVLLVARAAIIDQPAFGAPTPPTSSALAAAGAGGAPSVFPGGLPSASLEPGGTALASKSPTPSASASASPSPSPTPTPAARTYKVKAGDTLTLIAARFHTTVGALRDANGIANVRLIRIGQVLVIP